MRTFAVTCDKCQAPAATWFNVTLSGVRYPDEHRLEVDLEFDLCEACWNKLEKVAPPNSQVDHRGQR